MVNGKFLGILLTCNNFVIKTEKYCWANERIHGEMKSVIGVEGTI